MKTSLVTKKIYSDIQEKLYYMVPEKWSSIYLYASIFEGINNIETGEMFFYYFPKGILKKEPINVYEIPSKFNIEESEYFQLTDSLYERIKKLKQDYYENNKRKWTNVTIIIKDNQFQAEYGYEDLKNSKYNSYDRHIIWKYFYLNPNINTYNKDERKIINSFIQEHGNNEAEKELYIENIYKNKVNNALNYNREEKVDDEVEELKFVISEEQNKNEKSSINQILRY